MNENSNCQYSMTVRSFYALGKRIRGSCWMENHFTGLLDNAFIVHPKNSGSNRYLTEFLYTLRLYKRIPQVFCDIEELSHGF